MNRLINPNDVDDLSPFDEDWYPTYVPPEQQAQPPVSEDCYTNDEDECPF